MGRLSAGKHHRKRKLRLNKDQRTQNWRGLSAQQLVPAEELPEFVPVTTVGDGFCYFRSIATLISGDESFNEELRRRTVVEMALNKAYYPLMRIYRTE